MIELPNLSYLHVFNTHLNASYITDDIYLVKTALDIRKS